MDNLITIDKALELSNSLFIDLRSPSEYQEAHIPGAINLPLLENEERAIIGKIYKEDSPEIAVDKGFSLVAPKLPNFHIKLKEYSKKNNIVLYCWRGGMRSKSISQILNILGTKHFRLIGGYKSFRRHVYNFFQEPFIKEIVVLDGLTGVGKTDILQALKGQGLPAIDLEDLANNRGSVFGYVGQDHAPTQKQFEGLLFMEYQRYRHFPRLVVECESRRIGSVLIPDYFFLAMKEGQHVLIYDTLENRIKRLVATYTNDKKDKKDVQLTDAINRLRKRLGHSQVDNLLSLLKNDDYGQIVQILLVDYYDPLYNYPKGPSLEYEINLNAGQMEETLQYLKRLLMI